MSQYQHLNVKLAPVWDELHKHLNPHFDFSHMEKVFVDTVALGTDRNPACYYSGVIVVDPSVFELDVWYSDYTGVTSEHPLAFVLLHEFAHYLQQSSQLPVISDAEREADEFAVKCLEAYKEM